MESHLSRKLLGPLGAAGWLTSLRRQEKLHLLLVAALGTLVFNAALVSSAWAGAPPIDRKVYFGDTHAHSAYSSDAFGFGNRLPPDTAYRLARGDKVKHVGNYSVQLKSPLDFFMLTDHAEMIGIAQIASDPSTILYQTSLGEDLRDPDQKAGGARFLNALQTAAGSGVAPDGYSNESTRTIWQALVELAELYNDPGHFTTFAAFEWSSMPNGENLHRNVIFRDAQKVPDLPFSAMDSTKPEDLWTYLEKQRARGNDNLAIPHNGNMSNGRMFQPVDSWGAPISAEYAMRRMENEPLFEMMQLKGTSETMPSFAPEDEFADFELLPFSLYTWQRVEQQKTSYVREAYKSGLRFQETIGANPFKFGLEGGGDDHGSTHTWEEFNYHGGHAVLDSTPKDRMTGTIPLEGAAKNLNARMSAGGITGVWADGNNREAIFAAMRRKETFASSGVKIAPRFFAGWDFPPDLTAQTNWVRKAYATGVPMGGDLEPQSAQQAASTSPSFAVSALRDPNSAPLQRIQIIKGWTKNGEMMEKVYDVACSDGAKVDPNTHRCPANGAEVNLKTCAISSDKGSAALAATWKDPDFDPSLPAFYYVRVLENPVCRWSTRDAIALGVPPPDVVAPVIQERVWTSPIWYTPSREKLGGRKLVRQ